MSRSALAQVAVIMSTYAERPEWLRASIESILGQTVSDFRYYIVLDNPENDELNSIVQEYAQQDERIVVLPNEHNLGLPKSLNRAIEVSEEEYIARMDADDIAFPNRLAEEIDFLEKEKLDFVAAGADILSDDEVIPGRQFPAMYTNALVRIESFTNVMFHPTWLFKREVFKKLNGYRPIAACEDYDFVLRALQQGFKLGRTNATLLKYRFADSGISYSNYLQQEQARKFLQEQYKQGNHINDISIEEINCASENFSESNKERYAVAKKDYDELFSAMGAGKLVRACAIAMNGMLTNSIFREKIRDSIRDRVMIPYICKKYNTR